MPDVVQTYVTTHDVGKVIQLQRSILELYRQDISKYSKSTETIKIKAIFDSIASQLDDKNRRFFLNRIDENGRMNRYGNAFLWLSDAGVALPSYNVTEPQPPLQLNEKRNLFKLFMGEYRTSVCFLYGEYSIRTLTGKYGSKYGKYFGKCICPDNKSKWILFKLF